MSEERSTMSQTTQFVSIPLAEGQTSVRIASTAWGVGGAKIEDGEIKFQAGPNLIGARYVWRNVLVQGFRKKVPAGYKSAGNIIISYHKMVVLVELPNY